MKNKGLARPLHLACGNDKRGYLDYIYFIDDYAWVTNAIFIIQQHTDYINIENIKLLNGKAIHKDFFKELCKLPTATALENGIEFINNGVKLFYPCEELKPPEFQRVISELNKSEISEITIDAKAIEVISKCFLNEVNDYLKFTFNGENRLIVIEPDCANGMQKAYLAPVH